MKNVLTTHEKGRPILIGTTSVESSEEMVSALTDLGIEDVKVLNARYQKYHRTSTLYTNLIKYMHAPFAGHWIATVQILKNM